VLFSEHRPDAHWSELVHAPPFATAVTHAPFTQFAPATHGFFSPDVSPGAGVKPKQLWPIAAGAAHTKLVLHTAAPAQSLPIWQAAPIASGSPQVSVLIWHARPLSQLAPAQLWPRSAYAVQTAVFVPLVLNPQYRPDAQGVWKLDDNAQLAPTVRSATHCGLVSVPVGAHRHWTC
jgi:hypothetical protein